MRSRIPRVPSASASSTTARPACDSREPLTDKPSPPRRDSILQHLAYRGAPDQRLALLQRVPSFAYLVDHLTRAIVELGL